MTNKLILGVVVGLLQPAIGICAQNRNVRAVLNDAHKEVDEKKQIKVYSELENAPLEDSKDVQALYEEARSLEKEYSGKKSRVSVGVRTDKVLKALSRATDSRHHAVVAQMLKTENDSFSGSEPWASKSENDAQIQALKVARVRTLIEAVGHGKNREALPLLRSMYTRGGPLASGAVKGLGLIGDPADLQMFIREIKRNPKARIDIGPFGAPAIEAIMAEVDNPSTTETERQALVGHLLSPASRETIGKYFSLLHHKNRVVAKVAAEALGRELGPQDDVIINQLLLDSDPKIRREALLAIDERAWRPERVSTIVSLLKNDPDDGVKAEAANVLGHHKVSSAVPDLREAYKNGSNWVRDAVEGALKSIGRDIE